jgi:hypothetical protein
MQFPDIAPSKSDVQRQVAEALHAEKLRLYVDSSVLIHCYEMSRSACEELLSALDSFGERVRVPVWCAKEIWEHTRGPASKRPLQKMAGQVNKRLADLRMQSLRYVDERTFDDMTVEDYTRKLDEAIGEVERLTRRVERIEPSHDAANARLLPFIADRTINSDMVSIYSEIQETGEARYSHQVPPGFGDGGSRPGIEGGDESEEAMLKGKKRNRYGDLIMWLEALFNCAETQGEHLVVLTRDNTKRDWALNPDKVIGDNGRPQQNGGLITLPLPMLVQEAKRRCPSVKTVDVISLELFVQVMRVSFGARLSNLARALQAAAKSVKTTGLPDRVDDRGVQEAPDLSSLSFSSEDMIFEPSEHETARPIWQVLNDLKAEGWTIQNEAASRLPGLLMDATDNELKQVGRGLLDAANEDALGPVDTAIELVRSDLLPVRVKANVIVGLLAETYFDADGEPKKPMAHPEIVKALFDQGRVPGLKRAYEITVAERLAPVRRLYLALPGEELDAIRVQVVVNDGQLISLQANDRELLEPDAPDGRRLSSTEGTVSVTELVEAVAQEFVVPANLLIVEGPTNFDLTVPDRMGFIAWGPSSGERLR